MAIWTITGFGIPGDEATVQANGIEHAKALLANHLQSLGIEFNHTDTWNVAPAAYPLIVVKWQN